ncbi:hypothetical protein LX36DRAFT_649616 [Colletotrichum falcatum]|nr:hypothetical protein LX36DRAFT_649616 [Colletotrichum falcatum]
MVTGLSFLPSSAFFDFAHLAPHLQSPYRSPNYLGFIKVLQIAQPHLIFASRYTTHSITFGAPSLSPIVIQSTNLSRLPRQSSAPRGKDAGHLGFSPDLLRVFANSSEFTSG